MRTAVVPKLRDPRFLILLFFSVLIANILSTPGFARSWYHFAAASSICIGLDLILAWYRERKIIFPMSGLVSSFGCAVLIDSPVLWPTMLAALFATLSKHLVRLNDRHLFNPNNFGVVIVILAFPDWAVSGAMRWGGQIGWSLVLFAIGLLVVQQADRWVASLSYMGSFIFFNVLRSLYFEKPLWLYSISLLGPAMQLFIFYMISDPRTSPNDRRRQAFFGIAIGLLDNVFRHYSLKDAPLFALFIICGVYNIYRWVWPDRSVFNIWKTKEILIGQRA